MEVAQIEKLVVFGAKKLEGEITVQGSKNASLPIIVASILNKGTTVLKRCPMLNDTVNVCKILKEIGCFVKREKDALIIDSSVVNANSISKDLMNLTRSSIIFLGALIARCGEAKLFFPGGCNIGKRPIDMHLSSLEKMGVRIKMNPNGELHCVLKEKTLIGAKIFLNFPSVGATENIIISAVLAKGRTEIVNAATEPEIENLCCFLKGCGAKINGIGTQNLIIDGVDKLNSSEFSIMPDRIVASTLLCAGAITKGEVVLKQSSAKHIEFVLSILERMGCEIKVYRDCVSLKHVKELNSVEKIVTTPHPGFPTDAQPILMALTCVSKGETKFIETIFENRFMHVSQLRKFGVKIEISDRTATVKWVDKLHGANVCAPDLRGGAALIIAALAAEGRSEIRNLIFVDRGYELIEKQLQKLGGLVYREQDLI